MHNLTLHTLAYTILECLFFFLLKLLYKYIKLHKVYQRLLYTKYICVRLCTLPVYIF